jgi:hypothetical protein
VAKQKQNQSPKQKQSNTESAEIDLGGLSKPLLQALHILTRDGQLNQDSRRKLKQVRHLVQFLEPGLEGMKTIADMGAGKSYLGFMLYDLWLRNQNEARLYAIESREELVRACEKIAQESGFDRTTFVSSTILDAMENQALPETLDVVTALHACDTATDEAIAFALKKKARFIALVPCCQAEVARLLEEVAVHPLWRHGIHRREFGSHVTNVVRALVLEAHGYKVRVTELIGWEHSMKNELILATKIQNGNAQAKAQLQRVLKDIFGGSTESEAPMTLFRLIADV